MNQKLTKKLIDSFKYDGDGKRDIRWDSEIRGFGIRLYPSGKKSFVISYRSNGRKHLMVLDQYGKITLDEARKLAQQRFGEIANRENPLKVKKAATKKNKWTVNKAFKDYLSRYAKAQTKSWEQVERFFEFDVLPQWGKHPLEDIKREDVIKMIDAIVDRGSRVMANRALAYLRKFFNWSVERGLIEFSPAQNISKPASEKARDRILSDSELRHVWLACNEVGYPFGYLMQMCLLTGQRRGETVNMRWNQIDLDKALWTLPKEMTKSDRAHTVPLSPLAVQILENAPKLGDYVFTSSGKRPFDNFTRGKGQVDRRTNQIRKAEALPHIRHWTPHDLRRTFASGLAGLGTAPHVIEKMLNHSSGIISGVAAVYNRYEYANEKEAAINAWSDKIEELLWGEEESVPKKA